MISYCFFIDIEIKKANEDHINISHENYKYIDSSFEASDKWTNRDNFNFELKLELKWKCEFDIDVKI